MNGTSRYDMRRRKRLNRILNTAIGVVAVFILFFAAQLFLSDDEEVSEEPKEDVMEDEKVKEGQDESQKEDNESPVSEEEEEENLVDENDSLSEPETVIGESDEMEHESENNEDGQRIVNDDPTAVDESEWEPIGTEQSGPFEHNFNSNSQNWEEMIRAIEYATNLEVDDPDVQLWRLENGGVDKAVGTLSNRGNEQTPYEVTIQWVPEQGWKPINVKKLNHNPYLEE